MRKHSNYPRILDLRWVKSKSRGVIWTGYSAKAASELIGLSESAIRKCVKDGLVAGPKKSFPVKLNFQDLAVLRTVKKLEKKGVPHKKIRAELGQLKIDSIPKRTLSAWNIDAIMGKVVIENEKMKWQANSGQLFLDFDFQSVAEKQVAKDNIREIKWNHPGEYDADDWMEKAVALEEDEPFKAIGAYEKVLTLRPDFTEAWVNKGRIFADLGKSKEAASAFRRALEIDPDDPTILYNLGVVAQDMGLESEAIDLYQRSLELDEELSEAHYNLATLFERIGQTQTAIRHIHAYRRLTR